MKFADYIEQFVTGPIGMAHSTFRQPLPAALEPLMSKGYKLGSGKPEPFEFVNPAPAGALSASGADMARFMMAHLQDGRLGDAQILKPETARLMHARQRGKSPDMNAMCLGFYEESRNGHRIISHGGDTMWFHSDLHLVLDAGVGFFVSYNSAGKGEVSSRTVLWHAFLDRYFPYTPPPAPRAANAAAEAKAVVGPYLISRRSESNFLRLLNLLSETTVSAEEDDTIEVDAFKKPNGKPLQFEPIGAGKFREVNGQELLVFLPGEGGPARARHVLSLLRLRAAAGLAEPEPAAAALDRHARDPAAGGDPLADRSDPSAALPEETRASARRAAAAAVDPNRLPGRRGRGRGVRWNPGRRASEHHALQRRMDPWLRLMQVLALLAIVGGIVALLSALRAWGSRFRGVWSKLGETLIAAGLHRLRRC